MDQTLTYKKIEPQDYFEETTGISAILKGQRSLLNIIQKFETIR